MTKLFVYGTLKCGMHNNRYMNSAKYLYNAELRGYDLFTNGSYPMIMKGTKSVLGEVWEIDENTPGFQNIIRLESGYIPTEVMVIRHTTINTGVEIVRALAFVGREGLHGREWELLPDGVFK